ncbi:hypothetical protein MTR67_017008 [Solanum verrucosum]|uniref:Pentatricopeptide repeat-containing protein n=1 Tax=Solanum verrucosum TaxID=315347 RepID=A0AAF0QI83_SOLVR|nr:hypothetical protein MTR67_017008 [Solanum verrucosum]
MMPGSGVKPTIESYSILIEQLLKESAFGQAYKVFHLMVSMGHKPDVCIYTSFLVAYYNEEKLKEADDVIDKMAEARVMPDVMAYTVMIDGYGRAGLLNRAFDVLKFMVDAGHEPSQYTYSILIKHLSQGGVDLKTEASFINIADVWKVVKYETLLELFDKMVEHRCPLNTSIFTSLTTGLCREGRLEEALRLLDHMQSCGISPGEDIYTSMRDLIELTINKAIQLKGNFPFKKSLQSHHIVNVATPERLRRLYNILTICCLQALVDVSQIYNHYAWVGISRNTFVYSILIDNWAQRDDV